MIRWTYSFVMMGNKSRPDMILWASDDDDCMVPQSGEYVVIPNGVISGPMVVNRVVHNYVERRTDILLLQERRPYVATPILDPVKNRTFVAETVRRNPS